jgi:hypothetical protein
VAPFDFTVICPDERPVVQDSIPLLLKAVELHDDVESKSPPMTVSDMQFDGDKFRRWSQRHNSATRSQWKVRWEGNRRRIEKAAEPNEKSKPNHQYIAEHPEYFTRGDAESWENDPSSYVCE